VGVAHGPGGLASQVIAVHGHVEGANRDPDAFDFVHYRRESVGQHNAPGGNSHEHQVLRTAIRLEDLVGHPSACADDLISVEGHPGVHGTAAHARRRIIGSGLRRAGT
jgi:hypothetical protein